MRGKEKEKKVCTVTALAMTETKTVVGSDRQRAPRNVVNCLG